jgi:aspartyl-tRNA(Asn)/glutamyl-tRNA(Gln) amidotransferase subunit A
MKPIAALARDLAEGKTTSVALTTEALARIEDKDGEGPRAFIRVFREPALAAAAASDSLRKQGVVPSPLAGIPVSIKDLCDVAGVTTLAGSIVMRNQKPAAKDAAVVARLRAAGAVIVGTTNMTEFAMGGLGLNPHYGNVKNTYDRKTGRVPGGSSSGAAISVTDGMSAMGLGTDTAGSVRIPAAFNGLAGFKPTVGRIPTDGVFPLSTTLDSVGPLAGTVACCAVTDAIWAGETPAVPDPVPLEGLRFAVPTTVVMDDLEPAVANAFHAALRKLSKHGVRIETIAIPEFAELAQLARVRFPSMVEGYAIHKERVATAANDMDPRIVGRLRAGGEIPGYVYYEAMESLKDIRVRAAKVTSRYDAVVMPTIVTTAPPIARFTETEEGRRDFFVVVIRNCSIGNLLERCALTVPCQEKGAAPVGFMLMGERMADKRLLAIGQSVEAALAPEF